MNDVLGLRPASSRRGVNVEEKLIVDDELGLTPVSDLDLMIAMGYGDVPQNELPPDWRRRRNKTKP